MTLRRAVACLLSAAVLAGCGTTVPLSAQSQLPSTDGGLGAPNAAAPETSTAEVPGLTNGPLDGGTGTAGPAPGSTGSTPPTTGGAEPTTPLGPGSTGRITSPIVVGVLGIKRNTELANAAGVDTGQTFAPTEAFKAAAMRFGGSIQGRKLTLVIAEIDPNSNSWSSDYEAACQRLTQDNKASVVLSLDVIGVEPFSACLNKAGVAQINTGFNGFDKDGYDRYPNVVHLNSPDTDARVRTVVDGSRATGRLRAGDKVGVVVEQCPANERAYDRTLLPALRSAGAVVTRYDVGCINGAGSLGAAGSALSGAVLQFAAAGVTKVVFASGFESALVLLLAAQSESQGFRPTYLLSSTAAMSTILSNMPAGQRPGLTGLGWMPSMDTSAGFTPTSDSQRACVATMKASRLDPKGGLDALAAYSACDAFSLLDRALAQTGGATSIAALRAGFAAVSSSTAITSVLKESIRLSGDRSTGPLLVRPWQWVRDCDCLRYTGVDRPL